GARAVTSRGSSARRRSSSRAERSGRSRNGSSSRGSGPRAASACATRQQKTSGSGSSNSSWNVHVCGLWSHPRGSTRESACWRSQGPRARRSTSSTPFPAAGGRAAGGASVESATRQRATAYAGLQKDPTGHEPHVCLVEAGVRAALRLLHGRHEPLEPAQALRGEAGDPSVSLVPHARKYPGGYRTRTMLAARLGWATISPSRPASGSQALPRACDRNAGRQPPADGTHAGFAPPRATTQVAAGEHPSNTVRCEYRLPNPAHQDLEFQTKDLECLLDHYVTAARAPRRASSRPRSG